MFDWTWFVGMMDFYAVYFTTQVVRCAAFSFLLLGIVMLIRKTILSAHIFLRGMLWTWFAVIPFLGRLRIFYENKFIRNATWRMTQGTMTFLWFDRIYMAGILTTAVCIFGKRLRLKKTIARMHTAVTENPDILITDMNITPFAVGLFRPKIMIPKVMAENYSMEELRVIIQHERTHIRLGHLWCGFAWDVLRCLLWINPFLTICLKDVRADMEDICDKVCIQHSGKTPYEYAMILLKSIEILRFGQERIPPAFTYAGENDFADMKQRMEKIARFCPYRKRWSLGMAAGTFFAILITIFVVQMHSYAHYSESNDIMIFQYDKEASFISSDTKTLSKMISYDDNFVYVDRKAFEQFLSKNHAKGDIYIIFGGYEKLPGIGGQAEVCIYENSSKENVVRISYKSIKENRGYLFHKLL